jgi:hypothetical protein
MTVVLVCIQNFQEYILTNICQLVKLGHSNIFVLTNGFLFHHFNECKEQVTLIDINNLSDSYQFYANTTLDKDFRNGFMAFTSLRFFYIYAFMEKYDMKDVIHLENDVLIYYNCEKIIDLFNRECMYVPFDTFERNIASIMYIPSASVFKCILDRYDFTKHDMQIFSIIKKETNLIENFPIFIQHENQTEEERFVSDNFELFSYIFDPGAIGQYLGGIDPRNTTITDTTGYVNDTCVIKYNNYDIWFETIEGIKRPFIKMEDKIVPIFNLHVHCKNLKMFV